jgi:hypothetical protein
VKSLCVVFAAYALVAAMGSIAPAHSQNISRSPQAGTYLNGLHDFDFLVGEWRVHHRRLKSKSHEWAEFEGTSSNRNLMDAGANIEEQTLNAPNGVYHAVALRSYDLKTGQWAIWWLDSRMPHNPLDPPVKGGFKDGVGTFYSDDTLRGKTIRVRYTWSKITKDSAHWEQAYSPDAGKTWEVNWDMDFVRAS